MEEEEKSKSLAKLKNKHEAMITDLEGEARWPGASCPSRTLSSVPLIGVPGSAQGSASALRQGRQASGTLSGSPASQGCRLIAAWQDGCLCEE